MSAISSIEWTDRTWNPVRGCSVVSPGCVNCYAMRLAHRFSGHGRAYEGLTKLTARSGPQWTGVVRTVEDALLEPLSWRKPARVFVNSMSDLFHEDVPDAFILKVLDTVRRCQRHVFQVLTKRPGRMRDLMSRLRFDSSGAGLMWLGDEVSLNRQGQTISFAPMMKNLWLGVSVEDQKHADERIPLLLQTPAAVRFISAEPLLGPVDLYQYLGGGRNPIGSAYGGRGIDWCIVGGESGPGARPFHLSSARSLRDQCRGARVAYFLKQLGSHCVVIEGSADARLTLGQGGRVDDCGRVHLRDRKGGDEAEWPADLQGQRQFPEART